MVFPPTHWFQGLSGKKRLSDIEFLAKKEFDGKLRQNDGSLASSTTGDLATLTASSGKDMYLAKAKISIISNALANDLVGTVVLKINGVIEETTKWRLGGGTEKGIEYFTYEFVNIGFKVAATEIIKLEGTVNTLSQIEGVITCFEEDTGVDPTI